MYEQRFSTPNTHMNTFASTCPETHLMPAQVSPTQHIVKKNTIVHVIPHFHPPSTCDSTNLPFQTTPIEPMWMSPNCCHHPRKRPLFMRGRRL